VAGTSSSFVLFPFHHDAALISDAGDYEKPFLMPIEGLNFRSLLTYSLSTNLIDIFSIAGRGTVATGRVCLYLVIRLNKLSLAIRSNVVLSRRVPRLRLLVLELASARH
jgi:hypothetical protein